MKREKAAKLFKRDNPFAKVVTKPKFEVLNRRLKGVTGTPAISKSNSYEQRKKSILAELKTKSRSGKFFDRRLGEKNPEMTEEEKMLQRFAIERSKRVPKSISLEGAPSSSYSLTHGGRSISELDSFSDVPHSDDDDEDGELSAIDSSIVKHSHFGGFDDEEMEGAAADESASGIKKTKAEVMREIIAKSKMYKHERQKIKEENEMLREELNEDFEDIQSLLFKSEKDSPQIEKEKLYASNLSTVYDTAVKDMIYDKRAVPSNRTKTAEEIALNESEKLAALEKSRLSRMRGDDIEDDYVPEDFEESLSEASESIEEFYSSEEEKENEPVCINPSKELKRVDDVPFVIEIPLSMKKFISFTQEYELNALCLAITRITTYYHPAAHPESKPSMEKFTRFLFQYIEENLANFTCIEILNKICDCALTLTKTFPRYVAEHFKLRIYAHLDYFNEQISSKKYIFDIPAEFLLVYRLCCAIFSASDFYHPILTPANLLLSFVFEKVRIESKDVLAKVLYLCENFLKTQSLSLRFMPELMNCLFGALYRFAADDKKKNDISQFYYIENITFSVSDDKASDCTAAGLLQMIFYEPNNISSKVSFSFLKEKILNLVLLACDTYATNIAFPELFQPFCNVLLNLKSEHADLLAKRLAEVRNSRRPLELQKFKPAEIQTLEPDYEFGHSLDRKSSGKNVSYSESEIQRLKSQVKQEKKAVIKELRRDNAVLSLHKHAVKMQKDLEYKQKINAIMGQIANESTAPKRPSSAGPSSAFEQKKKQKLSKF